MLLFACYWLTRFKLPDAPSQTHAQENSTHKQALKRFLISPITPPLLIGLAIYYMAHSMFDAYFSWHLIDLGYSETWIGVGWSIGVFAEVLIMGIFHKLLRKVAPMHLLIFAAIVSALRWYALANTHDLVWILLSQPLHAITFGIFYLSCTHWLQLKGVLIRSTTQSIGLSCIALGTLAGYQVGGHLLQHHSSTSMFQLMTTLALGAGLLFSVALALERHQEKFAKTQ